MKKLGLLLLGVLIFCFSAFPVHAIKIADFEVLDPFITVGESFDVNVSVFDNGDLGDLTGFGFDVDPLRSLSLIYFDGYTISPDYADLGSGFSNPIEGIYLGLDNTGTDVLLATLSFTALIAGTDALEIDGINDGFFSGLYYLFGDESIEGSTDITINTAPVPEPMTILLLGAGLLGLAGLRRKKR